MRSSPRATWSSSGGLVLIVALNWGAIARADSLQDNSRVAASDAGAVATTPTVGVGAPASVPVPGEAWSTVLKERLGIAASLRAAFFSKDLSFTGETGFAIGSFWLTAKPEEVLGIRTFFDARVQGQNLSRSSHLTWDVREAYAETSLGDFDFKAGRQLTVWGRADKVNPTDVWSSRDYTFLAADDEDQLLGIAALQVAWNHWDHRLIAYWQPEWRPPVYPLGFLPPGITIRNLSPAGQLAQIGMKLDHSGGRVDYAFSYAHLINKSPDLALLSAAPTGIDLGFQFNKIDVVGADAAIVLGDYGLRAEVAYTQTGNTAGSNPLEQDSTLFGVVGVDRTFGGALNVNVQYLHRHVFNWRDASQIADSTLRLGAVQEQLATNQLARDMPGASTRLDFKAFNETLEVECAFVIWFTKADATLRPKVTYALTDHFKAVVGGQIYLGPTASFFGRFDSASAVLAEVRANF